MRVKPRPKGHIVTGGDVSQTRSGSRERRTRGRSGWPDGWPDGWIDGFIGECGLKLAVKNNAM
jgi:hypothetical protein